ncbi:MAG: lamin tail domain-containing protein [Kiritimatiellae bacterium]|nr:lamin tail domain-containing protein [Kiritimatiellia bacterium]
MVQKLNRLCGRVDFRLLALLSILMLIVSVGWSVAQFSDESNTVDSYEDLVQRYLDYREKSYPMCVPDWYLYASQIESIESTYGLAGFQEQPDWYVTFNVGDFYISPKSSLAKEVAHGTKLIIYEDMIGGELLVMRDTGEDFEEEVVYKVPDWPNTKSGEPYKNYLFRELSKRRVVWQVTLKDADLAAEEYEAMLADQEEEEEGGGQMMLLMSGGDELAIAEMKKVTNGLLLNIEYTASFSGTVWSAYSYDTPACVDTNDGGGGGGGGDPPPPGTNECTNCVMNCEANPTNSFMGLERVWELVYTNLLLTGETFTAWTDTRPMGFDAETNHVNRFYSFGNNEIDTDEDGLNDAFELFVVKTDPEDEDTDGDGMPDGWEWSNGLDPLDDADAALDPDMDGWRNIEEFDQTTDPFDRLSNPGFGPGLMINQFVYNPSPGENQWVELFNRNLLPIDISGFRIEASEYASMEVMYEFPSNTVIQAADFLVIAESGGSTTGDLTGTLNLDIPYNGSTTRTAAIRISGPGGNPETNEVLIVDACLYEWPNNEGYYEGGFDNFFDEYYAPYAKPGQSIIRNPQGRDLNIGGSEWTWKTNPVPRYAGTSDPDQDGLSTIDELTGALNPFGSRPTEPFTADSDGDGLNDSNEVFAVSSTDPLDMDTDSDGYPWGTNTFTLDGSEATYGTSPSNPDSDGDGFYDGWEIALGYSPTNWEDHATLDYDGDGVSNLAEQNQNSQPDSTNSYTAVPFNVIEYHKPKSGWNNGDDMGENGTWLGLKFVGIKTTQTISVVLGEGGPVTEYFSVSWENVATNYTTGGRTSITSAIVSDTNLVPRLIVKNESPEPNLSPPERGADLRYDHITVEMTRPDVAALSKYFHNDFDSASTGVCEVACIVKIRPDLEIVRSMLESNVQWLIDGVSGSTLSWENGGSGYGIANYDLAFNDWREKAVFTSLPATNSSFGLKNVTVSVGVLDLVSSGHTKVFFERDALNHPGVGSGTTPNWFYYWQQGAVGGGMSDFVYGGTNGDIRGQYVSSTDTLYLYSAAPEAKYTSTVTHKTNTNLIFSIGINADGIDAVAGTVIHEKKHQWIHQTWSTLPDTDGDGVPDAQENIAPYYFSVNDADTYALASTIHPTYATYGDNEFLCRQEEPGYVSDATKDWAYPGKQWTDGITEY